MKKTGGQKELVKDVIPVLEDGETETKLAEITELYDDAKQYRKLHKEVKEIIQGFVLGLPEKDQAIGRLRCGEFILPFKVVDKEEKERNFVVPAGKKVTFRLKPDEEGEEE